MRLLPEFLSDGFSTVPGAWTETIWARLAGWPVVALLSWHVWLMLPPGIHDWMSISALQGVAEPAFLTFACSALFLIVIGGYGSFPGMGLGPNWTSPIAAYLLFPFIAVVLVRWTNLHGWIVPIIAISPLPVLEILFALVDSALQAIERWYPMPPTKAAVVSPHPRLGMVGFGLVSVRDMSWHVVLTSRDPVLLRKAAQEARDCDTSEVADILDRRAAQYDSARLAADRSGV
ncbi:MULTISPECIES: hypothetical protein [Acidithiobacillus]|uniref:hypothetical protein n=1 Tax=Acidithiobacillus ferrivorans TaxID=160808 RepID=UPI001C06C1B2|nr:hypothetical protein [Acidithiobacillus ferrivorans]MBU2851169.1 hypothetical protein [Acidithiobacillus ferrivorans]